MISYFSLSLSLSLYIYIYIYIYIYEYICNIIKQNSPEMEDFITFCLSCPLQPGHIDSWHNIDLHNKSCFRSLILNAFIYTFLSLFCPYAIFHGSSMGSACTNAKQWFAGKYTFGCTLQMPRYADSITDKVK